MTCVAYHSRYGLKGASDYAFLTPVLTRSVERLLAEADVRIGPVLRAADDGRYDVLFVHRDGAGCAEEHRQAIRALRDARCVAVVPVREMEAWALCDGEALRKALGTSRTDAELGLPRAPADVEKLPDPKQALKQVLERGRSKTRWRPPREPHSYLRPIGEFVSLERLGAVPAYRQWREDTMQAFKELRLL